MDEKQIKAIVEDARVKTAVESLIIYIDAESRSNRVGEDGQPLYSGGKRRRAQDERHSKMWNLCVVIGKLTPH